VTIASPHPPRRVFERAGLLLREPRRVLPALRRRLGLPKAKPKPKPKPAPTGPAPVGLSRSARLQVIVKGLDLSRAGLEIGASHMPLLRKADGHNIKIADHLDREGLIAKYSYKSTAQIEEVDYVLKPGRLTDSIPDRFDYILASHVLEHTVCMISFLQDCETLLNEAGTLTLALPDKRFTFDRFRERAALGRVVDTFRNPPAVHTEGSVLEHNLMMVDKNKKTAWFDGAPGDFHFRYGRDRVEQQVAVAVGGEYVDTHNWVLTPNHFRLLVHDLHTLGFIKLREQSFTDSIDHEFFITLSLAGSGSGLSREQLAELSQDELAVAGSHRFG
jgi:hypothetical protein